MINLNLFPEDIPVQADGSKLPTIDEDESSAKSKIRKALLKRDKGDKSKAKESKVSESRSMTNGDTPSDGVQVTVTSHRGQQRTVVDSVEMTAFKKSTSHAKEIAETNSIPYSGKHNSPNVKANSAMKTSVSNKDIKNAKMTSSNSHTRNLSGGSGGSEPFSTDL